MPPGLAVNVTFPVLLGSGPTRSGKLLVFGSNWNGFGVVLFVVNESGCPELQLKMPPNCQRSTRRDIHAGALPSNSRFGPNGNSKVPLLRTSCVRWNVCNVFVDRFRGSRMLVPMARLQVYVVWFVKPCDKRFVMPTCIEWYVELFKLPTIAAPPNVRLPNCGLVTMKFSGSPARLNSPPTSPVKLEF